MKYKQQISAPQHPQAPNNNQIDSERSQAKAFEAF